MAENPGSAVGAGVGIERTGAVAATRPVDAAPSRAKSRARRRRWTERPLRATPAMKRYAEAICRPDAPASDAERCQKAGIKPRRLTLWRKHPDFESWLDREANRLLARQAVQVWNEVLKQARQGNVQAARLFVEYFSRPPKSPGAGRDTFPLAGILGRS